MSTHSRRLEDHIRELCAKIAASEKSDDVPPMIAELRAALHQAVERLRTRAAAALSRQTEYPEDRRKTS
jgi:hypothetical protein